MHANPGHHQILTNCPSHFTSVLVPFLQLRKIWTPTSLMCDPVLRVPDPNLNTCMQLINAVPIYTITQVSDISQNGYYILKASLLYIFNSFFISQLLIPSIPIFKILKSRTKFYTFFISCYLFLKIYQLGFFILGLLNKLWAVKLD